MDYDDEVRPDLPPPPPSNPPYLSFTLFLKVVYCYEIQVEKGFRRKGLGRFMMKVASFDFDSDRGTRNILRLFPLQ